MESYCRISARSNSRRKASPRLSASGEVKVSRHRSAQGLAHAARGMLAQTDGRVMASLPHIRVPTLVLVGALDQPFLAATDYMAGKDPRRRSA